MVCLINQTNYLLDHQIKALEKQFLEQGGFTERLYHGRREYRDGASKTDMTYKTYKNVGGEAL